MVNFNACMGQAPKTPEHSSRGTPALHPRGNTENNNTHGMYVIPPRLRQKELLRWLKTTNAPPARLASSYIESAAVRCNDDKGIMAKLKNTWDVLSAGGVSINHYNEPTRERMKAAASKLESIAKKEFKEDIKTYSAHLKPSEKLMRMVSTDSEYDNQLKLALSESI